MSMISDITIGQYYKGDSFVHKLDPRAKIILTVLFVAMIFMCKSFISLALVLGVILLSVAVSKVPFKMFAKSLKPIVPIVLFTAIINIFYITGGKELVSLGFINSNIYGVPIAVNIDLGAAIISPKPSLNICVAIS